MGNEGMLGSMIVLSVLRAWGRTLVQVSGLAVKLPVAALLTHLEQQPLFRTILAQYQDAFTRQLFQVGACNLAHDARAVCTLAPDDPGSGRAGDLHPHSAVPRPDAWRAARDGGSRPRAPQARGLVTYVRGRFQVRDRAGLEAVGARVSAHHRNLPAHADGSVPRLTPRMRFCAYNSLYFKIVFCAQIWHAQVVSCMAGSMTCTVVPKHTTRASDPPCHRYRTPFLCEVVHCPRMRGVSK